jgi:hypothetical protein
MRILPAWATFNMITVGIFAPCFAQTASPPSISSMLTASAFGAYPGVAAPGSYVEIHGSNLAATTRQWAASDFTGSAAPTSLDGVSVSVGGAPAIAACLAPMRRHKHLAGRQRITPATFPAQRAGTNQLQSFRQLSQSRRQARGRFHFWNQFDLSSTTVALYRTSAACGLHGTEEIVDGLTHFHLHFSTRFACASPSVGGSRYKSQRSVASPVRYLVRVPLKSAASV